MAGEIIGTVQSIQGVVSVRDAKGVVRRLMVGEDLREGDTVLTDGNGRAVIQLADGGSVSIEAGQMVAMTSELSAGRYPGADESQVASLDPLARAVLEGTGDLNRELEAAPTAAGELAIPGNEGHTFVQLLRVVELASSPNSPTTAVFPGQQGVINRTLPLLNAPPVATPDENDPVTDPIVEEGINQEGAPVAGNSSTAGNVLPNDSDVDSSALVVVGIGTGGAAGAVGQPVEGTYGTLVINPDGSYIYTLNNDDPDTDGLGVDQTAQDVFVYTIADEQGNTDSTTLTINIVGTNDNPVIVAVDAAGTVTEDTADPTLSDTGTITFEDVDLIDSHTVSVAPVDVPLGGTLTASITDPATGTGDGTVTWVYTVANAATQYLDAGESVVERYSVTISDGNGGTVTQLVTVTVFGANDGPTITVSTGNEGGNGGANDVVHEAGLESGSGNGPTVTDVGGTFQVADADGLDDIQSVTVNGQTFAIASLVGQTVDGSNGVLTITAYDAETGVASYRYQLTQPSVDVEGVAESDVFRLSTSDGTASSAPATITIEIVDDAPRARDDVGIQAAETPQVVVNVLANDTRGADGVDPATGVALVPNTLTGTGTLSYADGVFSYVPAVGEEGTVSFDYTITDGDGDTSTATVTITLAADSTPTVTVIQGGDGTVNEAEIVDTTSGTFGITTGNDGIGSLVVGGVDVTGGGTVVGQYGTLVVTLVEGVYNWTYTLGDNTLDHNDPNSTGTPEGVTDSFDVVVTDTDGDVTPAATLTIAVLDDGPVAVDDSATQAQEGAPVQVNVLGNDSFGADGANAGSSVALVPNTLTGTGTLSYADGVFSYVPAVGEEGTVSFDYTITDGDGDTSTATVTITLAADSTPTVTVIQGGDGTVNEAEIVDTTSGTFGITTGNDGIGSLVVGGVDVTGGGTVVGQYGTLVVTLVEGVYNWTYTLGDNTLDHNDPNSTGTPEGVTDSFDVVVTDTDGDVTPAATLTIAVLDDGPVAVADIRTAVEGVDLDGNVLTDGTPDDFGADGASLGGGVVGVRAANGNTTAEVTTGTGTTILGQFGTLVLNADGTYIYNGTPNSVGVNGGSDVFVYTIQDGDGDRSTTTLTINVTDSGLATVNDNSGVKEGALPFGSVPNPVNITAIGTVVDDVSGGVGPYTYTLNSPAVGTYGTLTFNPDGSYRYILERPYDSQPDADDGRNPEDNREQFAYTVTDAAGNTVQGFIFIDIIDDVPTAYSNTRTAIEGADLGGNVLSDGPVADVFGADGPTAGGGVVGVRLAGSDTTTAVTGGTGTTILGQFGTLVLNADGTYIYNGTPNSVGVNGGSDVFVYTIQDGDGDRSTTTLTINVTDSGLATVNDNSGVKEGALPFGSVPNPVNITAIGTVVDDVSGGVGPYTYTLNSPAVGTYGTLTFNPDGSYRYILERPYDSQPDADDGRNPEDNREQFAYTVTDAAGNTVQGFIFIDIIDDIPIASSDVDSVREDGPLLATGNVVTGTDIAGSDANDSDGVADLAGADGLGSVIWTGAVGSTVAGSFGTLTVGADGGYSYALDNDDAAVQRLNENQSLSETFEYTIVDGDGDRSTATLTINVLGANDDAPQLVVIDNKPGTVIGGSNDDVLIGDLGGVQTGAIPGQNYNIALVVDVSLSMQPRMELLKESLNNLLDALKDHDGSINITLISFSDTARELATVTGLNSVNVESLISAVNGLQASGYTNYESAFNTAINWFSDTSNANPGHIDQTYFVTDGDPTRHLDANGNVAGSGSTTSFTTLDNSVSSFAGLAAISQVSAIGIGEGVNSNYLRFFDTTSTTGVGSVSLGGTSWTALADFNNPGSTGLNSTAGWSTGGGTGTVSISNDYLRLQEVRQSSGAQTASTFTSTNIAVVEGGAVRFDYRSENGNSSDVVQWRLLRADGSIADSGSISATQSSSGEITTDTLSAGSYRLQFVLQDNSSSNALGLRIDNIELGAPQTVTGPVGEPQIVQTAEELSAVLIRGSTTSEELPVSSDVLVGGDGDDLLFGDTLYTDNLPGSHPDGSGFEVIESMLGKDYDNPADRADIYDYIKDNVDILTRPSDPRGGDDTIIGGQGNDLMFGQGGSDTFVFRLADKGTAAVPAIDTIADFNTAAVDAGGDVLDLRDLLQGESGTAVSLDNFLSFNVSGGNTTISVSSTPGGAVEQQITLTGVDLSAGGTLNSDAAIIQNLLNGNKLVTDGG